MEKKRDMHSGQFGFFFNLSGLSILFSIEVYVLFLKAEFKIQFKIFAAEIQFGKTIDIKLEIISF